MLKKLFVGFSTVAVIAASAASYNVSLFQDSNIEGKEVKAGDYKFQLKDNNAVIKHNKQSFEVPAHAETVSKKFNSTTVRYGKDGDVQEILLGGTNTKIVFSSGGSGTANGTR